MSNAQLRNNEQPLVGQPQDHHQPQKVNFFSTPLGKGVFWLGLILIFISLVWLKITIVNHSHTENIQTQSELTQDKALLHHCKTYSDFVPGITCTNAQLSDDNREIELTYRILLDELVETVELG